MKPTQAFTRFTLVTLMLCAGATLAQEAPPTPDQRAENREVRQEQRIDQGVASRTASMIGKSAEPSPKPPIICFNSNNDCVV